MEHLGKYIEDKNFIQWVFQPDEELEAWWSRFEVDHPEEKKSILLARKVLLKFRTRNHGLTEEEKIALFASVLKQIEARQNPNHLKRFAGRIFSYAAVALIFFSMGALLFYKQNSYHPQLITEKLSEPIPENSAKLIRANGKNILLKNEKSVLKYEADGKLVVDSDTVHADKSESANQTAMNQLIIPYGKTSEVQLPDGTKVFLNAGSRLVYPENFTGKTREVMLVGEAFFEVKHDKQHPFIVQTDDFRVKVLGTKFNVSAYPTDNVVETVLAEGKVSLEKNEAGLFEKAIDLLPNQLVSFNRTTKETYLRTVDTDNYILWTEGLLKFESTDLSRITKRLERYYNVRFQYAEPLLGGLRISGKLQLKEDFNEVCERVSRAASVKIIKKGEGLYEIAR
jgi:hypothetical protein